MDARSSWRLLLLGWAALSLAASALPAERPPNLLFILVDDLGKEWVSCYGAEDIQTPHIDRLAATGMRFENAYCMPQCTPTRVTFLTGQYPFRHGWVNHWDVPRWGGGASFDPELNPCLPRTLRAAGYATAAAGKWQIDDFRQEPDAMEAAGFDDWCMWTGYEADNPPSARRYQDPYLFTREGSRTYADRFGPDVFVDFLVDFMQRHRERPMFLYYPMVLTHGPLVATPENPAASTPMEKHRAMVRYTDRLLGRLVAALDSLGLREDTILLWSTDNGTSRGIVGRRHGRRIEGGKGETSEAGVCVPFIVNGPGRIPAGVVTDALVDFSDLLPTFIELAGARMPAATPIDGHSFAPLLLGEAESSGREWILAMGGANEAKLTEKGVQNRWWFRDRVLRDRRYKLFIGTDGQPVRFVDLETDPEERRNLLADVPAAATASFHKLLDAARQLPRQDADPRYRSLPHQEWYRPVEAQADVWKSGHPGRW